MQHYFKQILILVSLVFSINATASSNDVSEINHVMNKLLHAYVERDATKIGAFYTPDALVIGTGTDEIINGRTNIIAGFARDFKESTKASISLKKIAVDVKGTVALASYWATVKISIPNSAPFVSKLRWTLTLMKENDQWLIAQSHLSAPMANEEPGKSFPHTPA